MKVISCEFNIDTACVELRLEDGTLIAIDCTAVENKVADNMYERSELDYLIYNAPLEYADLILNGDPVKYLTTVTVYKPFESLFGEWTKCPLTTPHRRPWSNPTGGGAAWCNPTGGFLHSHKKVTY